MIPAGITPGGTEIRIIDMRRAPSLKPDRMGKNDTHFTYMLGAEGPFLITVPEEDLLGRGFDEQKSVVRERILKEQEERLKWRGAGL